MDKLIIRKATSTDSTLIYNLVKQLVSSQNLLHQFTATESVMREHLFGESPRAEVIIGDLNNIAVAYAIYFFSFSTFTGKPGLYLEDIFVDSNHRGHGFGHELLYFLANIAIKNKCSHMDLRVLSTNTSAIHFYNQLGGEATPEWITYCFDNSILSKLKNHQIS